MAMPPADRFDIIVPLHEVAGWRRALAIDRGGVAPRTVVLSYPPPSLTDDPTRLVGLMRDAEAAALVHHPNAVPALGLETAGDLLVAVEAYRRGVPLRALLHAAGRLPAELAARVAVDACAGLAAVHGVDAGDGQPLVHGDVSAARLLVADDGSTLLCGTGTGGGGASSADVRAVAAVLHECLVGEPPPPAPAPLDAMDVPRPLLEVMSRALGLGPGDPYDGAEALAAAIAGALPPAPPEAMAAYLEAILPAGEGERGELLRLVAHGLSRSVSRASDPTDAGRLPTPVEITRPEPPMAPAAEHDGPAPAPVVVPPPAASPAQEPPRAPPPALVAAPLPPAASVASSAPSLPGPGHAVAMPQVQAQPVPAAAANPGRSRVALAVALGMAIAGFGGGFLASRWRAPAPADALATAPAAPATPGTAAEAQLGAPTASALAPAPAPQAPAPPAPVAPPAVAPPARPRATAAASIAVTAEPPGEVYLDGKRVGRSPVTVPASRGEHEVRLRSTYEGVDVRRRVTVSGPGTSVRFALRRGALKVTAPEDAEVIVDGRRVGRGDVKVDLWEGTHNVEARLGEARVNERFTVRPGETWTYDVTPTK
jgi:hypothetical protein